MLGPMVDDAPIRERWLVVRDALDERGRRLWAAAEARSHGRGGIAAVVRATGMSEMTVRRGLAEVDRGQRPPEGRIRRAGAGRPSISERYPGLKEALLALLEGVTRGDPPLPGAPPVPPRGARVFDEHAPSASKRIRPPRPTWPTPRRRAPPTGG